VRQARQAFADLNLGYASAGAQSSSNYGAMFAMSVVSLVPLFIAFLLGQRFLLRGFATTGMK